MRVLHCSPTLMAGRAERPLAYLAVERVRIGHDVHVAFIGDGPLVERVRAGGATVHQLHGRGYRDPRLIWRIYRLIGSVKPDIVNTWLVQMDVIGGAAALARRRPWVISER